MKYTFRLYIPVCGFAIAMFLFGTGGITIWDRRCSSLGPAVLQFGTGGIQIWERRYSNLGAAVFKFGAAEYCLGPAVPGPMRGRRSVFDSPRVLLSCNAECPEVKGPRSSGAKKLFGVMRGRRSVFDSPTRLGSC